MEIRSVSGQIHQPAEGPDILVFLKFRPGETASNSGSQATELYAELLGTCDETLNVLLGRNRVDEKREREKQKKTERERGTQNIRKG